MSAAQRHLLAFHATVAGGVTAALAAAERRPAAGRTRPRRAPAPPARCAASERAASALQSFSEDDVRWMRMAMTLAEESAAADEVPVGAVLISERNELVCAARNRVEECTDCTAHAELECVRIASQRRKSWRLLGCTLYCTLEPCVMCLGALQLARVRRVVYAAEDTRLGAVHSYVSIPLEEHPYHVIEVRGGLLAEESVGLLKGFFRRRRADAQSKASAASQFDAGL